MLPPEYQPPKEPDFNPYASPGDLPGDRDESRGLLETEDDATRRAHLARERSVRAMGFLSYLAAVFCGLVVVAGLLGGLFMAARLALSDRWNEQEMVLYAAKATLGGCVYLALTGFFFVFGRDLRRLKSWARWTSVVFCILAMLFGCIAFVNLALNREIVAGFATLGFWAGVSGFCLYLLLSRRTSILFTPEYRALVARTPDVRLQTAPWLKWLVILGVFIIVATVVVIFWLVLAKQ